MQPDLLAAQVFIEAICRAAMKVTAWTWGEFLAQIPNWAPGPICFSCCFILALIRYGSDELQAAPENAATPPSFTRKSLKVKHSADDDVHDAKRGKLSNE